MFYDKLEDGKRTSALEEDEDSQDYITIIEIYMNLNKYFVSKSCSYFNKNNTSSIYVTVISLKVSPV